MKKILSIQIFVQTRVSVRSFLFSLVLSQPEKKNSDLNTVYFPIKKCVNELSQNSLKFKQLTDDLHFLLVKRLTFLSFILFEELDISRCMFNSWATIPNLRALKLNKLELSFNYFNTDTFKPEKFKHAFQNLRELALNSVENNWEIFVALGIDIFLEICKEMYFSASKP